MVKYNMISNEKTHPQMNSPINHLYISHLWPSQALGPGPGPCLSLVATSTPVICSSPHITSRASRRTKLTKHHGAHGDSDIGCDLLELPSGNDIGCDIGCTYIYIYTYSYIYIYTHIYTGWWFQPYPYWKILVMFIKSQFSQWSLTYVSTPYWKICESHLGWSNSQ